MARYCQKIDDGYLYPYSLVLAERGDFRVVQADPRKVVNGYLAEDQQAAVQESTPEQALEGPSPSNFDNMTKDMLEAYARRNYGAELDKRHRKETLVRQVEAMEKGMTPQEALALNE